MAKRSVPVLRTSENPVPVSKGFLKELKKALLILLKERGQLTDEQLGRALLIAEREKC